MKKALKFLSIILSLAMVLSMFAMLPISAAEPTNLIQFPNFVLNENGKIEGWTFDTNNDSTYTIEENDDGYNTVVINSPTQDHMFNLGTTEISYLKADKYYKFSVWMKFDANADGNYGYHDWGSTSFILKEKSSNRYYIANADPTAALKGVWKEYSIIISGENFYTSDEKTYTELSLYSSATRCKLSLKKPSIVEYNPDVADEVATIEPTNIITNGEFSQYDGDASATASNRFTGYTIDYKGTYAINHEQVTDTVDGKETTAAKITYQRQSANLAVTSYFKPKVDKTKNYRIGAWIKLTNADVYDEETQKWVDGTTWNTDGSVALSVAKQNDQDASYRKTVAVSKTKDKWQYVSMMVDSEWLSNIWDSQIRVGVRVYACALNVYITGVTVEEFVGNVEAANAESVITNGDFETYNETTNKFAGWNISLWQTGTISTERADGISGNALKYIATNKDHTGEVKKSVTIDPAYDYRVTAYVKTESAEGAVFDNPDTTWNLLHIRATAGTAAVRSSEILYSDDWQKIELTVSDIPEGTTSLEFKLFAGQVKGIVLLDNISVVPITGGSVSVNRSNAAAGDTVYVTVNPDWGSRLAENGLTYLANGATESVAITESKAEVYTFQTGKDGVDRKVYTAVASDNPNLYQFTMPEKADIVVSAVFEEIAAIAGDANWNGTVDILDLIRVKKYLAGIDVNINLENATLETEIEGVDGNDLAALRRILLGV